MELRASVVLGRYDCETATDWEAPGQPYPPRRLPHFKDRSQCSKDRHHPKRGQEATGERHQLLRHLESDIHQFDRIYGFGLVDNHYFAIVVMVKERKLHIIDSMPTDAKALERIQKVSRRYKNTMLILISSSPATSIARWQGR
jgi:hypothetical protein